MQNNSRNRSEGARGLTPYQRTSLMLTSTPQDQIRIQGPQVTPRRRQQILQGATPDNITGITLDLLKTTLKV